MKRLGILLPSSGTVQEVDFYRRVPAGVSVHSARMRLTRATEDDEVRMLDAYTMPAAEDLATIHPDVVVFSCTSAGALRGRAYDASLCADIGRVTRAPVVSTLTAVGDALRAAGARSVALVTPYPEPITAHVRASLEAEGSSSPPPRASASPTASTSPRSSPRTSSASPSRSSGGAGRRGLPRLLHLPRL